ncbi:MAG: 5'-nucleotidase, partial [Gammaproteobacteria bacterium]|nr:5'-nucleotidase [Gammaproteobacteria bacterium]
MNRLVVAISSSALFDLTLSDQVYREEGVASYARYQIAHEEDPLAPGDAFEL